MFVVCAVMWQNKDTYIMMIPMWEWRVVTDGLVLAVNLTITACQSVLQVHQFRVEPTPSLFQFNQCSDVCCQLLPGRR